MRAAKYIAFLWILTIGSSCSTYQYFYDVNSRTRQKELRGHRAGNTFAEVLTLIGTVFFSALTNSEDIGYDPDPKEFKNLNLLNISRDTMYVNMLSDVKWDENNFCDFMDIRIPPGKRCRMLVPKYTRYNLYFSNTPDPGDDEMIEINTDKFRNIELYNGLTNKELINE